MILSKYNLFLITALILNDLVSSVNAKKPNILVIVGDDVGTGDVPGHWNTGIVNMPNLQNLVDQGTTFTDAHSTPLCGPSRYMLLSGNYQHRGVMYSGLWNLNYKTNQFQDGQQSIANVLRDNGYDTAMFGKWHIGGKIPTIDGFKPNSLYNAKKETVLRSPDHDWTKPLEQGPLDIGFDTSYITIGGIQNPPYAFYRNDMLEADLDKIILWNAGNYSMPLGLSKIKSSGEGVSYWDSTAYNMILVNETEKFLDNHISNRVDDPFFAYVALGAVHVPHSPPYFYLDGTPIAGEYANEHLDLLNEVDKVVGSLVQALQDRQLVNDTIIIFTSDNGGLGTRYTNSSEYGHLSNGPLRDSKGSIHEGGIRIPLTIRWDNGNIPKGVKRSKLVGLNDIFSTLCDLAEIEVPSDQAIDSVSFANHLYNEDADTREYYAAWTFHLLDNTGTMQESIRKNEMKLVTTRKASNSAYGIASNDVIFELYNLTADLSETTDVSEGNEDLIATMFNTLKSFGPCYDDENKFLITKGNIKKRVSCSWVANKKTKSRCRQHPEARRQCRFTCALGVNNNMCDFKKFTMEPTASPTPPLTFIENCIDKKTRFSFSFNNGRTKSVGCKWIARQGTQYRCQKFSVVRKHCPYTCFTLGKMSNLCQTTPTSDMEVSNNAFSIFN